MPSLSSFCAVENPFMPFSTRKAVMPWSLGLAVDHQHVGVRAVGDPHLVAVEDVPVAAALRAQAHADHVRARARLAHGERADLLAGDEPGQVPRLLRGRAVAADLVHAQIGMRAVGKADRRRGARDLLHGHDVREVAHHRAAEFLLDRDAEQAERAELLPQVRRKLVRTVDLRGARRDLLRARTRARWRAACRWSRRARNGGRGFPRVTPASRECPACRGASSASAACSPRACRRP